MPTWRGRGCKWAVFSYRIESSSLTFTFSLADLKIRGNLCNMSGQIKRDVLNAIYFCMTNRKKARFYIICLILITIKCLSDSFSINDWELSWFILLPDLSRFLNAKISSPIFYQSKSTGKSGFTLPRLRKEFTVVSLLRVRIEESKSLPDIF